MKTLSINQFHNAYERDINDLLEKVESVNAEIGIYQQANTPGLLVVLAKFFSDAIINAGECALILTDWGISNSSEHLSLLTTFRAAFGDDKPLIESPIHLFDQDSENLASLIIIVMLFRLDATIWSLSEDLVFKFSHDGWFRIRSSNDDTTQILNSGIDTFRIERF